MTGIKSYRLSSIYRYLVRNTWRYVSNLGTRYDEKLTLIKSHTLVNQMNFVMGGTMLILLIVLLIRLEIIDKSISIGVMRVFYTFLLCLLNLLMAVLSFRKFARFSLIFISPLVFMIIPSLLGFVEDEGYFYNGYVLIAASIIPQLILSPTANRKLYWASMTYYLLLIISIDAISLRFQQGKSEVAEFLSDLYFIDKLAQIFIFLFINICIYYLRRSNLLFEERLMVKNHVLNIQNQRITENRKEILQQKQIIEEINKSITDSITYASFIQSSILPKKDQLDLCIKDNFLLFKPAEIVSGDFLWVSKRGKKSFIVVADCTGHGVPGAFMSILGITLLDEIVNKELETDPGVILDHLRNDIIASLKQKGESAEAKDGMEIALCVVDAENQKLEFAGANSPLYLIRNAGTNNIKTDQEIIEIKGNPMPVGISYEMSSFTTKEIEINEGDVYYLFTDGFADQFGGPSRKKFSYRQFKEQLIHTQSPDMKDQAIKLEKVLNSWKGSNNQTDDILVMGFRISGCGSQ